MLTDKEIHDLLLKHENNIRYFFSSKVSNYDDIDDLVQETMLQIVSALPKFRQNSQISTWVYSICKNTLYTYYYQNKKQTDIQNKLDGRPADNMIDDVDIRLIIDKLEKPLNTIYELYYKRNYKIYEIAEFLDKPVGTIKYWLFRLRVKLKDAIDK
jgi:RNA polymerase sigma-70 factor, ECF subfamily